MRQFRSIYCKSLCERKESRQWMATWQHLGLWNFLPDRSDSTPSKYVWLVFWLQNSIIYFVTCEALSTKRIKYQWRNSIATNDIKNNAWVTVNNDFLVTSGVICQWFSRVKKSRVKIIGKSPHEWPKIVIHGNECIILFLIRYFMSWSYRSATNNHRSVI